MRLSTAANQPAPVGDLQAMVEEFIETSHVQALRERMLAYLQAGYPVHLRGGAGTGKTTLALDVARRLGRPVTFLSGDSSFTSANLVGREAGSKVRSVVDRYVESIVRTESESTPQWLDERLTRACLEGHVLVYDEFTRARAEANNPLLNVLQERILVLPWSAGRRESVIRVHPAFCAIVTSNPQDYAGVHDTQDALADRLITIDLDFPDRETEVAVTAARSGLERGDVERIVDLVRDFRLSGEYAQAPTLRASIMIAKIVATQHFEVSVGDARFLQLCLDVLESKVPRERRKPADRERFRMLLARLVEHYCPATRSVGEPVEDEAR